MKTVLMLTRKESSVFRGLAESVSFTARKKGWALHMATAPNMKRAASLVATWNCDGCIVYAARLLGDMRQLKVPCICISPATPSDFAINITHDSSATGELAAQKLAELGLDEFAFAAPNGRTAWIVRRLGGFRKGLAAHGREPAVFTGGDLGAWLKSLPKPCGLFAANDEMAEKVVAAAAKAHVLVPSEVAVLGCDDDARICENAEVTISSIRQDYRRCGDIAAESLAAAMDGRRHGGECILFGDECIVHRASTRTLAVPSREVADALEFIRRNAFSGIAPADVIKRMHGSRRRAQGLFQSATGHSITDELHSVRLEEVKRLLANPRTIIGSIASRVGYDSENFLARLFKRTTGMTMREWRARAHHAEAN